MWRLLCFFFQAEDGIRGRLVTGVQTCALPIFIDQPRIAAVDLAEGGAQAVAVGGYEDEVDMVGHQTIGPNRRARLFGPVAQQLKIGLVVGRLEKNLHTADTALDDVVGMPRYDYSC